MKEINNLNSTKLLKNRFRGFYPVVLDVETGGLDPDKHALLEVAAYALECDEQTGILSVGEGVHHHIEPFAGSKITEESLKINKISPYHPFRFAVDENKALQEIFNFVKTKQKLYKCSRSVLIGHNSWFDLQFILAAAKRNKIKKHPFHQFTSFDTASLAGLHYGQTVLAKALDKAGIKFDANEHHTAKYDAQVTAELFCKIVNNTGWPENDNQKIL